MNKPIYYVIGFNSVKDYSNIRRWLHTTVDNNQYDLEFLSEEFESWFDTRCRHTMVFRMASSGLGRRFSLVCDLYGIKSELVDDVNDIAYVRSLCRSSRVES